MLVIMIVFVSFFSRVDRIRRTEMQIIFENIVLAKLSLVI